MRVTRRFFGNISDDYFYLFAYFLSLFELYQLTPQDLSQQEVYNFAVSVIYVYFGCLNITNVNAVEQWNYNLLGVIFYILFYMIAFILCKEVAFKRKKWLIVLCFRSTLKLFIIIRIYRIVFTVIKQYGSRNVFQALTLLPVSFDMHASAMILLLSTCKSVFNAVFLQI